MKTGMKVEMTAGQSCPVWVLKRVVAVQPGMDAPPAPCVKVGVGGMTVIGVATKVGVPGTEAVTVTTLLCVEGGVMMTGAGAGALPPPPPPDEPPPELPPPPPPPPLGAGAGAGAATATLVDWVAVSQVKVKLAAEPMELMVSVPVSPLAPLHPPDAEQVLAFVEDQVRTVEPPVVIEVGLAVMVAVGLGIAEGTVTIIVRDWVAVPQVKV